MRYEIQKGDGRFMKSFGYSEWSRLDNASKIFPSTWSQKDPKVFRIACELEDEVDPEILQAALDGVIEDIPVYKSVLRRGAFWYYLERSDIRPLVEAEETTVCAPIYTGQKDRLLFRVSYFKNRINMEVFHALSDGAGAICFFQTLLIRYMTLCYDIVWETQPKTAPLNGLMDDSFTKHYVGGGLKSRGGEKSEKAYRIRGTKFPDKRMGLVEGAMSVEKVLLEARRHKVSITAFLASLFIYSIGQEMNARGKKHPIVLNIPVNLRQYYESVTVRNFFGLAAIKCRLDKNSGEVEAIIQDVSESFKKTLTRERLDARANKLIAIERHPLARVIPLPMKNGILRIFANKALRNTTSSISNVGKISMPGEASPYIRQFSVCISASRPQMTLCSYGDRLVVSIASPFRETEIQGCFFRLLSKSGIEIEISSSM